MRGWGWIGGALVVLVGATLIVGLVGAPRRTAPEPPPARADVAAAAARVPRAEASAGALAEVRAVDADPRPFAPTGRGDDLADEIDRQRSAMQAAVELLIAGEDAGARIR